MSKELQEKENLIKKWSKSKKISASFTSTVEPIGKKQDPKIQEISGTPTFTLNTTITLPIKTNKKTKKVGLSMSFE